MTSDISRWQTPPECSHLDHNELHLWRFRTDLAATAVSSLRQTLAEDERARAERFLNSGKQQQFVVARACLRRVLSQYLQCSPDAVVFDFCDQGRPSLTGTQKNILDFNLSHSGVWGVVALARCAVGVDVEQVKAKQNLQALADYAFDADELRSFAAYAPARQQRGFFRIWTAKEARYKCPGEGYYLRSFPLSCNYLMTVASITPLSQIARFHLKSSIPVSCG